MKTKDTKKSKVVYYHDELHEDFGEIGLNRPPVPENYKYKRTNWFNTLMSGFLYHVIVKPLLWLFCFFIGIRVKGKRNLKALKGQGSFIYMNHVGYSDVLKVQAYIFFWRKRVNILGYSDTLSMPFVRNLTRALGYLPLPLKGDLKNMIRMQESFEFYIKKKQHILIFPEAHIWPYYTHIRPFKDGSFLYPAKCNAPVLPIVTTWRKSKLCKKPKQTLYILEPIFPKESLSINENKAYLHDETLKAMIEASNNVNQYEYVKYAKAEDRKED